MAASRAHEGFMRHGNFRYLRFAVILSIACVAAYTFVGVQPVRNGGSWMGYILGTVGALLIVWLTLLGLRKRAITPGNWSLKSWTSAHVYLGLSLVVIATLHTGFQFGLNVHTLAYALMLLVILSGVFGVIVYTVVPRRLSDNRAQTSQAEMIAEINAINRELQDVAQPLDEKEAKSVQAAIEKTRLGGSLGERLAGRPRRCATERALRRLKASATSRNDEKEDARQALDDVIGLLERKSALLARARQHIRYRAILEIWLYVHVPATFALLAALIVHIISVFYYA